MCFGAEPLQEWSHFVPRDFTAVSQTLHPVLLIEQSHRAYLPPRALQVGVGSQEPREAGGAEVVGSGTTCEQRLKVSAHAPLSHQTSSSCKISDEFLWKLEQHRVATIKLLHHYCSGSPSQGIWTKNEKKYKYRLVRIKFSRVIETPESNVINKTDGSFSLT